MKVVIDANRVFAALIRDGPTRHALFVTKAKVFSPDLVLDEIARHSDLIRKKAGTDAAAIDAVLGSLFAIIVRVPAGEYAAHLPTATEAMPDDAADAHYLAVALAVGADAIWSEDRDFDAQDLVPRTRHPDRIER